MTATKPLIPENIKVNVLSRWIDWSDVKNPRFKYIVEVVNGSERMTTEYSGGVLAFVDRDKIKNYFTLVNLGIKNIVLNIMKGTKYQYFPTDKNDQATQAINFLFQHSNPKAEDVFYSLLLDNDGGEMSFKEFCDTFGYDNDSIKAEKVWRACRANSEDFKRVVGKDINVLTEIFKDY